MQSCVGESPLNRDENSFVCDGECAFTIVRVDFPSFKKEKHFNGNKSEKKSLNIDEGRKKGEKNIFQPTFKAIKREKRYVRVRRDWVGRLVKGWKRKFCKKLF